VALGQGRLEVEHALGRAGGVVVLDDYGHHPTEIRATLAAAKGIWPGRIIVVFQPHRYTRTKALFNEFLAAFGDADQLIVTDIYAASEQPLPGVTSELLCEAIRGAGHRDVLYMPDFDAIARHLLRIAGPNDVILTQGAGSVWKVGEAFLKEALQGERKE